MTSNTRALYEHYVGLLKSDPVAKIIREAGNHDTRVSMLQERLGLTVTFAKLKVLTECRIVDPLGAVGHPATGEKYVPPVPGELPEDEGGQLIAYGASDSELDALEHALFGYCREAVQAKLA